MHLSRAFNFRRVNDASLQFDVSGAVAERHYQLNINYLMGIFFEGLASFLLARNSVGIEESEKWTKRGRSVLTRMRCWTEHSLWNWENKMLVLEAENFYAIGEFDKAASNYDRAICSANAHKFIHEEAIASELAGMFHHERGDHQKSYSYLVHAVTSYRKWGAHAVAERGQAFLDCSFGPEITTFRDGSGSDVLRANLFESNPSSSRKNRRDEAQ